jgi:hypothetical protein
MPRNMGTLLLAAVFVTVSAVGTAAAQPAPASQSRPAFELAQATVTALALADSIDQSIERIDRNRLADQSGRFEATTEARRALGRSQDANSLLGRPFGAPNSPVRKAAAAMRAPFSQLSTGLSEAIRIWEKLDRASDENEAVDLVRSSTTILSNEGPWERLVQATIGVTQVLLDVDRASVPGDVKSVRHLQLTKVERESVLASLRKSFPRLSTNARGGRPVEASAGVLFEFLNRPFANAEDP